GDPLSQYTFGSDRVQLPTLNILSVGAGGVTSLGRVEPEMLSVRKEPDAEPHDTIDFRHRDWSRVPRAGGQKGHFRRRAIDERSNPFAVRREASRVALSQPYRRRTV